jgi:sugar/nucleoside kinase (ribokinase family)
VRINSIVGRDRFDQLRALLEGCDIDIEGLVLGESPTFVWHAEHDFERWVTARERAEEGCDPEWRPRLPAASAAAHVMFVASMRPSVQVAVIDQSGAHLIAADTMTLYTDSDRDAVAAVAERVDLLFLNRMELTSLTGEGEWLPAAQGLIGRGRVRAVVVKRGPDGAAVVSSAGVVESSAYEVSRVVDPTGAGDALAGGFLGYCARAESDDDAAFEDALAAGLECAAHAISTFGTAGLRELVTRH